MYSKQQRDTKKLQEHMNRLKLLYENIRKTPFPDLYGPTVSYMRWNDRNYRGNWAAVYNTALSLRYLIDGEYGPKENNIGMLYESEEEVNCDLQGYVRGRMNKGDYRGDGITEFFEINIDQLEETLSYCRSVSRSEKNMLLIRGMKLE